MYVVGVQPTDIGVSDGVGALRNQATYRAPGRWCAPSLCAPAATPGIAAAPSGVENLSSVAVRSLDQRKVLG
jgi:hypothetical protein